MDDRPIIQRVGRQRCPGQLMSLSRSNDMGSKPWCTAHHGHHHHHAGVRSTTEHEAFVPRIHLDAKQVAKNAPRGEGQRNSEEARHWNMTPRKSSCRLNPPPPLPTKSQRRQQHPHQKFTFTLLREAPVFPRQSLKHEECIRPLNSPQHFSSFPSCGILQEYTNYPEQM